MIITRETHARMGLVGNPSDGFGGKTITVQIQQFRAVVTLWESPQLEIIPHPRHDPFRFESLASCTGSPAPTAIRRHASHLRLVQAL